MEATMKSTTLLAVALAALLAFAGTAAAFPGNAPVDTGANDAADNTDHRPDAAANASERGHGAAAADKRGPPTDMPSQVPDHVATIHDLIRQFVGGDLDGSLGEAISDVTPADDGEETTENETASAADRQSPENTTEGEPTNATAA